MKIKQWDVSVLGNRPVLQKKDVKFYTTDTDAYLKIKLTDSGIQPETATLMLYNKDDESLVSRSVDVVDNELSYQMKPEEIEHSGNWQAQLVYEQMKGGVPEKYTSGVMTFTVNSHIKDKKKPSLVEIENWEKFIAEGTELIETWEDLEALREENELQRQANEQARESAESERISNEEERISKDSERDSKIEAVEERIEENEEGLEQHKVDYVEDTKRVRATEPLGKLLAYDTFDRPDGSLGVSDSGHEWISYGTPAVISSGFHKGSSANNTLYDVSAIALGDEIRNSVLKVDVFTNQQFRGAGLFLGVDQENGISLFTTSSSLVLSKIVGGARTNLYQTPIYAPWGEIDSDWYIKVRVLQTLELTTVYVDSAVLFNVKIILNGVEFNEDIKMTDPETLSIISNVNKVGITQSHSNWYAKNFVARGLGV